MWRRGGSGNNPRKSPRKAGAREKFAMKNAGSIPRQRARTTRTTTTTKADDSEAKRNQEIVSNDEVESGVWTTGRSSKERIRGKRKKLMETVKTLNLDGVPIFSLHFFFKKGSFLLMGL